MITKDTYMYCNYCYEDFCPDLSHLNVAQIRIMAKKSGWKYIKGNDVCPKCFNQKIHLTEKSK